MSTAQLEASDFVSESELSIEESVDALLKRAVEMEASDLFLLSNVGGVTISARRFGSVLPIADVDCDRGRQMIRHIKAVAGMDISEQRRPLDGRWLRDIEGRTVELRVNCITTVSGVDMTLRIWDRQRGLRGIDELGLSNFNQRRLQSMLSRPSGLVLVTGPTGAGKTTTLYACLQELQASGRKINTIEDPVEYVIPGVRQSEANAKLGVNFPQLLRNILRQAPDVIMIGEVRDEETATTAVRAANSGHLVLATLHAPIAAGAVQSMFALGANPYFLSSCLLGVVAQRLLRRLCESCRVRYPMNDPEVFAEVAPLLEEGQGDAVYGPSGCEHCFRLGYSGRSGLFEILSLNQELRRLIANSATSNEIEEVAIQAGMIEFRRAALLKVAEGVTSTEDILRDVPAEYLGLED